MTSCWWLLGLALAAPMGGWRGDGAGHYAGATVPAALSVESATWSAPLAARGNASPVLLGDLVCVTAEPTAVACFDAATGRPSWTATLSYGDTLSGEAARAWQAELAGLPALRGRMLAVQQEIATLRRSARAGTSADALASRLTTLTTELGTLKARLDALTPKLTPDTQDLIGYASPTPVAADGRLYVTFGNGVAACFDRSGARQWAVWLGPGRRPMRGHESGSTASPLLIGDLLVVPHGALHALDARTGQTRWVRAPYEDYGTPAVARLPGLDLLLTPDGRAVRVRDGAQLAERLADVFYGGPTVVGDRVYWVGGHGRDDDPQNNHAWAWRLIPDGAGGLRTERLWERTLPSSPRIYVAPLEVGGLLFTVDHTGTLHTLSASTGELVSSLRLSDTLRSAPYPNPALVGDALVLQAQAGELVLLSPGATPKVLRSAQLGVSHLATPLYTPRGTWLRTYTDLRFFAR
jgi:outer membrane protein assembly factor BamB